MTQPQKGNSDISYNTDELGGYAKQKSQSPKDKSLI